MGHKSTELWEVVLAGFEVGLNGHESDIEAAERGGRLEADVIGDSPNVSSRFAWVMGLEAGPNIGKVSGANVSGFSNRFHGSETSEIEGTLDDPGVVCKDQVC